MSSSIPALPARVIRATVRKRPRACMAYVPVTLNPISAEPSTMGRKISFPLVATAAPAHSRIKRSPEMIQ